MKKYGTYVLQVVIFLFFIGPGFMKLAGTEEMVTLFERLGYPLWFMYVIGVAEVLGALGVALGGFIKKLLPSLAAGGLIVVMVGAFISHLIVDDPFTAAAPSLVNILLLNLFVFLSRKSSAQPKTVETKSVGEEEAN